MRTSAGAVCQPQLNHPRLSSPEGAAWYVENCARHKAIVRASVRGIEGTAPPRWRGIRMGGGNKKERAVRCVINLPYMNAPRLPLSPCCR